MRLVICCECDMALICNDTDGIRRCTCGAIAILREDGKNYYSGEAAIAVCLPDETIVKGVREAEDKKENVDIKAYVCHENDSKIYKIKSI